MAADCSSVSPAGLPCLCEPGHRLPHAAFDGFGEIITWGGKKPNPKGATKPKPGALVPLDPSCPACRQLADWRGAHPGLKINDAGMMVVTTDSHRRHPHLLQAPTGA